MQAKLSTVANSQYLAYNIAAKYTYNITLHSKSAVLTEQVLINRLGQNSKVLQQNCCNKLTN